MPAYPLLKKATEFLDALAKGYEADVDKLKKELEYFIKTYLRLFDNLEELKKIKDEMEELGFDSPYFGLGISMPDMEGKLGYADIENQRDISRHKRFFITSMLYKKNIFERTKCAISAHNIAMGHLEEFVAVKCRECEKLTRGKEAIAIILENRAFEKHFVCPKCSLSNAVLAPNEQGIYRIELVPLLPYGGESMKEISKFTPNERAAYREITAALKERKKKKIKSAMVFFKVKKGSNWINKKELVEMEKEGEVDFETVIRKKYGKIKVEKIRFYHERATLISGKYNRQALAIAYIKIFKNKRDEILNSLMKEKIDVERLKEYEELKREISSFPIEHYMGGREEVDRIEAKMVEKGFMDERGELSKEIEKAIKYRKEILEKYIVKLPLVILAWDVFKFLMIKPYRERRYSSVIPGLQPVPEEEQLKSVVCTLENDDVVGIVNKFLDKNIIRIDSACEMVFKKFYIEDILKDYLKATSSRAVGGATLYMYSQLSLEKASKIIYSEPEEIKEVIRIIMRLGKKEIIPKEKLAALKDIEEVETSEKALEFLKYVR